MNVTQYEHLIPSVATAEITSDKMNEVVAFIKVNPGVTCKEIGLLLYGKAYEYRTDLHRYSAHNRVAMGYASHLGHILSILTDRGYIIRKKEKTDEPVLDKMGNIVYTIDYDFVEDDNGEPAKVMVTDERGRTYEITNPFYRYNPKRVAHKKIVFKTFTRFYWNEGMN